MNKGLFWQTREDGVVHADPEGLTTGYYIYPPKYDENSPVDKYELWLINEDMSFSYDEVYQFDTLEQAKEAAITKFKATLVLSINL
mgnify:CR=1 FL=1